MDRQYYAAEFDNVDEALPILGASRDAAVF
jgi:hypothetical protein